MTNPMPLSPLEAELRRRLRRIDRSTDAGNGMPLADATATLVAADAVQAEAKPEKIARITDAELSSAMETAAQVLRGRAIEEIALPFGTKARGLDDGLVTVGDQHYVMVDIWGGLTREHEAPAAQAGPNLDRFLEQLRLETAGKACSALGLPDAINEGGAFDDHLLHFAPCAAAGGVSLDVPIDRPINQLPHDAFDAIVQLTAWAMEIFWNQRKALAWRASSARKIFQAEAAIAGQAAAGLSIADFRSRPFEFVDSQCETIHDKLSLYIGLQGLDAALRPGVDHWMMIGKIRAQRATACAVRNYINKTERSKQGGALHIDGLAAAIAKGAPGGSAAVLKRLSQQLATHVVLPISRGRQLVSRLYWSDGTIKASQYGHEHVQYHDAEVTLRNYPLPDTIENSLIGHRLDEIVEMPMPCAVTISRVERPYKGAIILHLDRVVHAVNLASGKIGKAISICPAVTLTEPPF